MVFGSVVEGCAYFTGFLLSDILYKLEESSKHFPPPPLFHWIHMKTSSLWGDSWDQENAPSVSVKSDLGVLCVSVSGDERFQCIGAKLLLTKTSVSGIAIHTQLQLAIESSQVGKEWPNARRPLDPWARFCRTCITRKTLCTRLFQLLKQLPEQAQGMKSASSQ